jgi:anaerobic dimethyl sulfoxide reductase subunit C (anchor subunit)
VADARDREWPLVGFTVAVQAASGLAVATAAVDTTAAGSPPVAILSPAPVVAALVLAGAASSWFHLGRGARAWRALIHVRRSPLSREVLATALFALSACGAALAWWVGDRAAASVWNDATAAFGLLAVAAAIPVYRVPARPVWNSWWVTASFLGSVLLLGGAGAAANLTGAGAPRAAGTLLGIAAAGAALQIVAGRAMAARFSLEWTRAASEGLEGPLTGWTATRRFRLGCQIGLAGVVPILLTLACWAAPGDAAADWRGALAAVTAAASAVGVVQGRRLMFDLGASIPRF